MGTDDDSVHFEHRWTDGGVDVAMAFTGAHLLHAAVAGCVLNDVHREAVQMGVVVHGVRVTARGGFTDTWASSGIEYTVEIDAPEPSVLEDLLTRVDLVAEIPRAIRQGASARRAH